MSQVEMAAMVRACHAGGLIGDEAAVAILAEAARIDRGRAAALLLAAIVPARRPLRDDGSWRP